MNIITKLRKRCAVYFRPATILLVFAFVCALLFTAFFLPQLPPYDETVLPRQAVRLHVLANSDSEADQAVKLKVRDAVNVLLAEPLQHAGSRDDALETLKDMQPEIQQASNAVLEQNGMDYSARVTIAREMFPQRTYGDNVYPAGEYDAVRVLLGEARGQNWWCVVFPPLCYLDIREAEIKDAQQLQEFLEQSDEDIEVKSAFAEWWQKIFGGGQT